MDRRVARTKKNIYYAFFQLVQTKAIDEITVSELARAADIDRKTFYLHYDSTDDIIREFAEEKTKELLLRLTLKSFFALRLNKKAFAQQARKIMVEEASRLLQENMELARMIAVNANMQFFWDQLEDTAVERLTEIYGRHSDSPVSDLKIRVTFFVAGAAAVYKRWLRGEIDCSATELGDRVSALAYTGFQGLMGD
jgi:AcrR family transcriptional regulator